MLHQVFYTPRKKFYLLRIALSGVLRTISMPKWLDVILTKVADVANDIGISPVGNSLIRSTLYRILYIPTYKPFHSTNCESYPGFYYSMT